MPGPWQRLRSVYRKAKKRRADTAAEWLVGDHEQEERRSRDPRTPIPPMRNNADWSGWGGL
jgi:hypothetical protein